jgi:hypothetical protein
VTERAPIAHAISRSLAHLSGGSAAEAARNLRSQRRLTTASAVQPLGHEEKAIRPAHCGSLHLVRGETIWACSGSRNGRRATSASRHAA